MLRTSMPELKAVVYFDRLATPVPGDPCAGFAAGGADSYLNQPHNEPRLLVPSRDATSRVRVPGRPQLEGRSAEAAEAEVDLQIGDRVDDA